MNAESLHAIAIQATAAVAALAALGEWLHARRSSRIATLVFGPQGHPRRWTVVAPWLRGAALAGMTWSLVTLLAYDQQSRDRDRRAEPDRHLLVLLDVSPSMLLADAGEHGDQTRKDRAREVLKSVLNRLPGDSLRFTVLGFYTEARTLVEQCRDRELVLHLAGDTPFHITYEPGKTDLLASINRAGESARDWPRKSTTLLVLSDGDSVAPTGLKTLPSSISNVWFAGVGDPARGSFIDGHQSRQDSGSLSQVARRLGGRYQDCNLRHLPAEALQGLTAQASGRSSWRKDRRLTALVTLAGSTALLCLLPILLHAFGSRWQPRRHAASPVSPRRSP